MQTDSIRSLAFSPSDLGRIWTKKEEKRKEKTSLVPSSSNLNLFTTSFCSQGDWAWGGQTAFSGPPGWLRCRARSGAHASWFWCFFPPYGPKPFSACLLYAWYCTLMWCLRPWLLQALPCWASLSGPPPLPPSRPSLPALSWKIPTLTMPMRMCPLMLLS